MGTEAKPSGRLAPHAMVDVWMGAVISVDGEDEGGGGALWLPLSLPLLLPQRQVPYSNFASCSN